MKTFIFILFVLMFSGCASKPVANIKLLSIERKSADYAQIEFESDYELDHLGNVIVICPLEPGVEIVNARNYNFFIKGNLNDQKPINSPWKYIADAYISTGKEKARAFLSDNARNNKYKELINNMTEIKCKVIMIKAFGPADYSNVFTIPKNELLKAFSLTK